MNSSTKQQHRISRHRRVRAKIIGTAERPRVSVFKSNQHVFVQFIDDDSNKTILSSKVISAKKTTPTPKGRGSNRSVEEIKGSKTEKATKIGEMLAEKAKEVGIKEAIFDRGGFKYHGRVKAVAEGLRKGGIKI